MRVFSDTLGASQDKLTKKAPYSEYAGLEQQGATIVWGNPADVNAVPDESFDVVYDNNGKDLEACQPLVDKFKVRSKFALHKYSTDKRDRDSRLLALLHGDLK